MEDRKGLDRMAVVAGALACVPPVLALVGWPLRVWWLAGAWGGTVPMAPSTAVCLIALGGLTVALGMSGGRMRVWWRAVALAVGAVALLSVVFGTRGGASPVDLLLVPIPPSIAGPTAGRMSPTTGVGLALLAFAAVAVASSSRRTRSYGVAASWATAVFGFIVLVGYLHGEAPFYGYRIVPASSPTAVAFTLVALGLVAVAGPGHLPMRMFIGSSPNALVLRANMPAGIVALVLATGIDEWATAYTGRYSAFAIGGAVLAMVAGLGFLLMRAVRRVELQLAEAQVDRREASEALVRSEERFRELFEHAPVPYQSLDSEGRILIVNKAWLEALGYARDEVVGRWFGDLLAGDGPDLFREGFPQFKARGEWHEATFEMVRKDGGTVTVEIEGRIGTDAQGYFDQTHCVLRDVTAHRRLEAEAALRREELERLVGERTADLQRMNEDLRAATEARDRFLASMSHELRTPLNSILGFSGSMLQGLAGDISDEQRRQLEMVRASGRRLLALVNDVLDLSKVAAGAMGVEVEQFGAEDLVRRIASEMGPPITSKGVVFEVDVTDAVLVTDAGKVEQILINLLDNSRKFTETGRVALVAGPSDPGGYEFSVIDTGVGISADEIDMVFDEFHQVGGHESMRQGTGLGLAISRRLAWLIGGEISLASVVGGGTTFKLWIPARPEA